MISKTAIIALAIVLTISVVGATVYFTQINPTAFLDTEKYQVLTVTTQNMEPTIIEGNKILVDKTVNPRDLSANYPDSDIIVYYRSIDKREFIVSRIVAVEEVDGKLVFRTKGDFNVPKYPEILSESSCDPWPVSENLIFGKVVDTNY
jgi:signal peptidase I